MPSNSTTRVRLAGKSFEEGTRIVHDGQPVPPTERSLARVDRGVADEQAGHRLAGVGAFFDRLLPGSCSGACAVPGDGAEFFVLGGGEPGLRDQRNLIGRPASFWAARRSTGASMAVAGKCVPGGGGPDDWEYNRRTTAWSWRRSV